MSGPKCLVHYTKNMKRHFWNLAREILWREKTIWSENNSVCILFLEYYYSYDMKHLYYLSLQYFYYEIICRNQKNKKKNSIQE